MLADVLKCLQDLAENCSSVYKGLNIYLLHQHSRSIFPETVLLHTEKDT